MTKYVPYVRTPEGYIERRSYAIFNSPDGNSGGCLAPYVHEEQLVGWPESRVYWAAKVGPSVGIAPLDFPFPSHHPQCRGQVLDVIGRGADACAGC